MRFGGTLLRADEQVIGQLDRRLHTGKHIAIFPYPSIHFAPAQRAKEAMDWMREIDVVFGCRCA
jgi:hypothetical protein